MRPTSEQLRAELKAVVRRAMRVAGRAECFQHATRVKAPVLSKYVGTAFPDHHMPLDVAADLEMETGQPLIAAALAALNGCRVVPDAAHAVSGFALADVSGLMAAGHRLTSELLSAFEDGAVDRSEARAIVAALDAAEAMQRQLRAKALFVIEGAAE